MFRGMLTALITPFKAQPVIRPEIDLEALAELVEWQLSCRVSGFVVCGTTGESATLELDERLMLIKRVVELVGHRAPVIAGTGVNCTRTSIELTQAAKKLGADGSLIVSPYYNKPTQEGLFQHFQTVATAGGLPVIIYNIPGRTAVDIAVETFERLVAVPNIVGVKEASGSAEKLMSLSTLASEKFTLLSGEDSLTYLTMAVGGHGVISASSNVIPEDMVKIVEAAGRGDYPKSLQAQQNAASIIKALFAETNPAPAKAALKMMGKLPADTLRLPLVQITPKTHELIERTLRAHR